MTTLRVRCCVPFCSHTRGQRKGDLPPIHEKTEWICGEHWMGIPKRMRQAHSRAWNWTAGLPYRRKGAPEGRLNRRAGRRIWERCKRYAIERAVGVA